jgi:hypothetical protein
MDTESRIKRLEEEVCYLHKDIANLINIIENFEPEIHTHYTNIFYTKQSMDDINNTNDLNDFI